MHAFVESSSKDEQSLFEKLKNSYEKESFSQCIKDMNQIKKIDLNKKNSSKEMAVIIKQLKKFWDHTVDYSLKNITVDYPYEIRKKTPIKFRYLKVAFFDHFLESDWKQQYQGKYGGPKDEKKSWKEWYFFNESQLDKLATIGEKMKWAIELGHKNYINFLLTQEKIKIKNIKFDKNISALSLCILNNFITLAKDIIANNQFDSKADDYGWTSLHHAVYCGYYDIAKLLIQRKMAINVKDNVGRYLLHIAVMKGYIDIITLLLKNGAKTNYKDKKGYPALFYAIVAKDLVIAELLIDHGADIKFKDNSGQTYLHIAVKLGLSSVVRYLIKHGINLDHKDKFGRTALHYACEFNQISCLNILLNEGSNPTLSDSINQTPLIILANSDNKEGMTLVHEHLLLKKF